jgi:hypothetical protein
MNRLARARLRMQCAAWRAHDEAHGPPSRGPWPGARSYVAVPASRYNNRAKNRTSAEGQTIMLLAFLLLVVLGMMLSPRSPW